MGAATRATSTVGLARAMAWRRRAWAALAAAGLAAGLWGWWATQLWGLPDVGEPFDVAAFEAVHVPDDRNAFVWYRAAAAMTSGLSRKLQADKRPAVRKFEGDWARASPAWREFLSQSGEALATWRAGTEKPEARYDHAEGLSLRTLLPVTMELRVLGQLAVLEGSRLEAEGDVAGAWGWYRAALRSSRHSGMHGFQIERITGAAIHKDGAAALTRWASDPRVDAALLRRALGEVVAIDAMTVPRSETLKMEYLVFTRSLGDPTMIEDMLVSRDPDSPADWCQDLPVSDSAKVPIQAARVLAADDRERSLRLARLMTANWLAQLDKPRSRRARLVRTAPPIYEAAPAAPAAARALPPAKLSEWLDSSFLAVREYLFLGKFAWALDLERDRQARLVVHLADQLYRREHGGRPPASPSELVGPDLPALPEGFDAPGTAGGKP